jgi:hypothetical protein
MKAQGKREARRPGLQNLKAHVALKGRNKYFGLSGLGRLLGC